MAVHTPPELATLIELLNTLDERTYTRHGSARTPGDELSTAADVARWLARHRLLAPGARVTAAQRDLVVDFRNALRQALSASPSHQDINRLLSGMPLTVQFSGNGTPRLAAGDRGVSGTLGTLAAAVATGQAQGTWQRVRICAAPDCHWVFYDKSRNGAGRWCSMAVCGNRYKTRRYREQRSSP